MRRALPEYRVEGIKTTIPFFTFIMNNPDFQAGELRHRLHRPHPAGASISRIAPSDGATLDAAIAAAAILAFEESQNVQLPEDTVSRWRRGGARSRRCGGAIEVHRPLSR